jgi:glutamyl-tRNA synthetase
VPETASQALGEETTEFIRKVALLNAYRHGGKAEPGPVLGRLLGERPDLKPMTQSLITVIRTIVDEVNAMPQKRQGEILQEKWPETLVETVRAEVKGLTPLPNVERWGRVVTRFSPNPDCVLHLGSARAIILSHDYAKMYKGRFLLRFEDTDPRLKKPVLEFYDAIREDLLWLDCRWDEEYIQSDRIPIYYEFAQKLLEDGSAYVCTCNPEEFRRRVLLSLPCPCRDQPPQLHLDRWERMRDGTFREGEAVLRVKTDLKHPNPAVRDWPALRIVEANHPRVGRRFRVWPLYNMACGVDDHLMGITHIIRGKEHLTNETRQRFLYSHLGWRYPEAIHYGRLKIRGALLSKSKILKGLKEGIYSHWDDPRLATFAALRRRGISSESIRRMIIEVGVKPVDATLSWENLYSINRKILDPTADRYFFVADQVPLSVNGLTKDYELTLPLHPERRGREGRALTVKVREGVGRVWISRNDLRALSEHSVVRLMGFINIEVDSVSQDRVEARYHSEGVREARMVKAPLIQWVPYEDPLPTSVIMQDSSTVKGLSETSCRRLKVGQVIQFERFGFVRVDSLNGSLQTYYSHG